MGSAAESLALGIDLGGTKILSTVSDARGRMRSRDHDETPSDEGRDAILRAIVQSARRALRKAGVEMADLSAVGVGAPGPSNPQTGILHVSPNLPGLRDIPITTILRERFGKPVFLINDANAAALAEYHFGAGRGSACFVYVTVSTGIGGGVLIDGRLFTGSTGGGAEIGHMTIDDKGPPCNCGNVGCWEALASGTALAKEAQRLIAKGQRTSMLEHAAGDPEQVDAKVVQQAAEQGDDLAQLLVARTAHYLGTGLANLINIFNPDRIALGGGLIRMGDMLVDPATTVARQRSFQSAFASVRLTTAELGRNSGVLGAAAHALRQVAGGGA
ncbi:MAG: ROK family protein [Desulfosarcina sp.]